MKCSIHQRNEAVSLKLNVLYDLSFISLNYSIPSDTKAALLSPYCILQPHVRLFALPNLYPWGEISDKTKDKPSYVYASPPQRSLLFSQRVYFSFFLHLRQSSQHQPPAIALRTQAPHSKATSGSPFSCRPTNQSCVIAPVRVSVCVCSHCTSFPGAVHSYKPCSVFIDAVYFVLYQINNKTQTQPEEQKRKVIHS